MTTLEVAKQYHELALQNRWDEIQHTFHHNDVICQEPEHVAQKGAQVVTKGKEAVKAKTDARRQMIEAIHRQECSEPLVAGNFFSVSLKRDVTFKNNVRMALEEIAVIHVVDGKIVLEQFFY